ncbi:MAG: response regulator [Candidatus Omnitrophota bacterium]
MIKVLIVDDEVDLLEAIRMRLEACGYEAITAVNGKEAISLIKKKAPDAVILDIMMPEMDGLETLREIRSFNRELPVFMLSAYGDGERVKETEELGIAGFIYKGTNLSKNVVELINEALKDK